LCPDLCSCPKGRILSYSLSRFSPPSAPYSRAHLAGAGGASFHGSRSSPARARGSSQKVLAAFCRCIDPGEEDWWPDCAILPLFLEGRMTWKEPFSHAQQEPCPASAGLSSWCLCRKHTAVDMLGSISPEAAIFVTFFPLHLVELPSARPCCALQAFLSELSLVCGSFMGFPPSCEGPPLSGLEPPSHSRSIWGKP
jgi:hypothetical protein